ncbi:MAG: transcription termination factor Rho [Litorilinea sp.]
MSNDIPKYASHVVKLTGRSGGKLRDPSVSFAAMPDDPTISADVVRKYGLVDGAQVEGEIRAGRKGAPPQLISVATINGLTPEAFRARTSFERLVAIDPSARFSLAEGDTSMRVIDLVAPIAQGSRVLIAAPPKAGKTGLLAGLAHAIHAGNPDTRLIMLLIDERPEEVTHFRRTVPAEVLASSSDQSTAEHVELAELTLAMVRCELECGRDVVILVDSLTRLARAVNLQGKGTRRTLTGGVDAGALEMPRRFFGLARNIEHSGSVTVVGTALIETGSAMDDLLYEEFKATGNCEIVLDRELAEARLFPAVSIPDSGTRREELIFNEDEMARITKLRRWLAGGSPKAALTALLKLVEQTETNAELLARIKV